MKTSTKMCSFFSENIQSKVGLFFNIFLVVFALLCSHSATALKGNVNSHDPSALIKDGNNYWQFTTGSGIYGSYSTDLINWTAGPQTVFPVGTWPSWINAAVPGFEGVFWAPDAIYMNGQYYLYYSVSTFGFSRSAIGVAVSSSLNNPNWQDLGMVVSSDGSSTAYNAIDPALFKDSNGKVFMSYGSFFGGLVVVEINPSTGKVLNGSPTSKLAGGNHSDWEAPYIIKEGSYYYFFANRGSCCRGVNSTYKIVMGRSTNIRGPYLDQNGVNLNNGGGTTVLNTSGRYIGPGHVGLLRENGSNFVSIHYYDGEDNGNAKLDIVNLGFSNGWPFLTRDWIAAGNYMITNKKSGKVWDAWGCSGALGENIAQGDWNNLTCQKWNFTPLGNGIYKIANQLGGRVADVYGCNPNNGTALNLWDWLNNDCQKFEIERAIDGSHVFTSITGNRVVEVPGGSASAGVQLTLWDYNGRTHQMWYIDWLSTTQSAVSNLSQENSIVKKSISSSINLFPNPSNSGNFNVELKGMDEIEWEVTVRDIQGKNVFQRNIRGNGKHKINAQVRAGIYFVSIKSDGEMILNKMVVN